MSRFTFGLEARPSRLICLDVDAFRWKTTGISLTRWASSCRHRAAFMDFARVEAKGLVTQGPGRRGSKPLVPVNREPARKPVTSRRASAQAALSVRQSEFHPRQ
jgi:hypothetical protein